MSSLIVHPIKWVADWWKARKKEKARLALFRGAEVKVGEQTIEVVWDGPIGPIPELQQPRVLTETERTAVVTAISSDDEWQVGFDSAESPKGAVLWETDKARSWRRKLRGEPGPNARYVLRVYRRR